MKKKMGKNNSWNTDIFEEKDDMRMTRSRSEMKENKKRKTTKPKKIRRLPGREGQRERERERTKKKRKNEKM